MSLTILLKGGPQMMVTLLWVTGYHLIPIRVVKSMGAYAAMMPYKTTRISRSTEFLSSWEEINNTKRVYYTSTWTKII